jgi:hypothetical protein
MIGFLRGDRALDWVGGIASNVYADKAVSQYRVGSIGLRRGEDVPDFPQAANRVLSVDSTR